MSVSFHQNHIRARIVSAFHQKILSRELRLTYVRLEGY
jgi:hypothetical protein